MARVLGENPHPQPVPLRFVKLFGAGGLGFVALFDARDETAGQPWNVNLYVCKGALRRRVISRYKNGVYAQRARDAYRYAVAGLRMERENQDVGPNHELYAQTFTRLRLKGTNNTDKPFPP